MQSNNTERYSRPKQRTDWCKGLESKIKVAAVWISAEAGSTRRSADLVPHPKQHYLRLSLR
eukprot:4932988-Amphidinium_carterae.1